MNKQRTKKSILKRVKITSTGKIMRKHQFGSGHLKRHKSKTALLRQTKTFEFFKADSKKFRKVLGL